MEKLTKIQNELIVPKLRYNEFGGFYYRKLEDIFDPLKPLLLKYKSSLYFDDAWENNVLTTSLHFKNDEEEIITHASTPMGEHKKMSLEQAAGTCMSYTHKYALENLFLLDDAVDPDSIEPDTDKPKRRVTPSKQVDYTNEIENVGKIGTVEMLTKWKNEHPKITTVKEIREAMILKYSQLKQQEND